MNFVQTQTSPRGNDPTFVPQNLGPNSAARYTTTYGYDSNGNLIQVSHPVVNPFGVPHPSFSPAYGAQAVIEAFEYNSFGQVTKSTGASGIVTDYTYNATTGYLDSVETDGTFTTAYEYDALGNLLSEKDAKGALSSFTYDMNCNAVSGEGPPSRMNAFMGHKSGFWGALESLPPGHAVNVSMQFDEDGNPTAAYIAKPGSTEKFRLTYFTFDELDQAVSVSVHAFRNASLPVSAYGTNLTTTYAYDLNASVVG